MLRILFKVPIVFLFFALIFIGKPGFAKEVYTFGMLPIYYPEKIGTMILPLGIYLNQNTGFRIVLTFTDNSQEYEFLAKKGDIQLGYQNPVSLINISKTHEVVAKAVGEDGSNEYRGIIIVPAASPISNMSELMGKTVMIVGKNSGGGYLSQKLSLMDVGINTDKDLKLVKAADAKQENVIISVSLGDVDAGFIRESALTDFKGYIRPGSVKILKKCKTLPGWAFSVSRKMPDEDKEAIKAALVAIPGDHAILKALGIKKFISAKDDDYAKMNQIKEE